MALIGLFNAVGNLVAYNIMCCRDIASRKRCLTKWITVLEVRLAVVWFGL